MSKAGRETVDQKSDASREMGDCLEVVYLERI